ncbi:hypothetical protein [Sphaerisporangium rubeum]|uniref:Uncharacterized protein n=1 Tax=Sphaerisporangium rubeum TaxID=321317 RepID=A0A7X0M7F2_9ACTN|nr:hypothetical protein [Sphaerisporangium rubeum]MBB6474485.1 hypothetical protein [Sphaerisporangium rubeum]
MKGKKVLVYLAVAFFVFYLYSRPADAADAVRGLMDGIGDGASRLALFFSELLG